MINLRSRKMAKRALWLSVLSGVLTVSGYAQTTTEKKDGKEKDEVQKLEKFEVTGSRIKQTDVEGPSPIRVIDRQTIEMTGRSNLTELLRDLPEASAIGINEGGTISAVRGATALDLRNLGPNNTLVIVDGRREALTASASGGTTFVDLNRFPLGMIERIEVLKDGASAIYGSDATAGVVNIILRKDYNGAEITASYGNGEGSDTGEKQFTFFGGASAGKLRASVAASYFGRNALAASDKWFSSNADLTARYLAKGSAYEDNAYAGAFDLRSGTGPQARIGLTGAAAGQVNGVNGVNIPGLAVGTKIIALPGTGGTVAGTLASATPSFTSPYQNGTGGVFNATAAGTYVKQILAAGVDSPNNLYNFQPWVWLVPETDRRGIHARFSYDLTPTVELYTHFVYQRNVTETHLAPSPISTAGDNNIIVPKTNYWNPFGVDVSFNYRPTEVGPRIAKITDVVHGMLAGVKGTMLGKWDWDVGYKYSYDDNRDATEASAVSESRLRAALAKTDATALNIFGGPNFKNNKSTIDSFKVTSYKAGTSDLSIFDAKISGPVLDIYSGEIGAAALIEYREESFNTANDSLSTTLDDIIGQVRLADATSSFRTITSYAAEVNVPLVKPATIPFLYKFDLRAAARYESFSDGYNSGVKPGVGVKYQPLRSLAVRASYNRTFRAPTLPQLYSGESQSLPNALPDYSRPQLLTGDPFDGSSTQRLVRAGGNSNLKPEQGTTKQIGLLWDVPFKPLEGLSLEATWGEIWMKDIITTVGTSTIRANEYTPGYEGLIIRDPGTETYTNNTTSSITVYTGPGPRSLASANKVVAPGQSITVPGRILSIKDSYVNLAYQRVRYYDFGVKYSKKTVNAGRFSFNGSMTYLQEYASTRDRSQPLTNYANVDGYPLYRIQSSLAWERKSWGAGITENYTPSYGVIDYDGYRVNNYYTTGVYVQYTIPDVPLLSGARITFGIDNVFDKEPGLYYDGVGYDQSMIARPQGRYYRLTLTKSF